MKYAIEIPKTGLADPEALAGCADGRPRHRAARKLAAGADHLLVVPRSWSAWALLMFGLGLFSLWCALARHALCSRGCCICSRLAMGPAGFIAVLAGWITTETGRQPFTVYGLLRTADSASPLAAPAVGILADRLRHRLFRRVRRRRDLSPAPDGAAAASRRSGPADQCPCARRRHHARRRNRRRNECMVIDLATRLGLHHRLRRVRLCRDGRLRSRPRHSLSAVSGEGRPRRHHEQRRAGLGRQRDLAGARRRRHDGGVSARLLPC